MPQWMGFVWSAVALYGLYLLLGWIRRPGPTRRGSASAVGNAFLTVQAIFEPAQRHVLEERVKEHVEDQDVGAPPRPGAPRT